MRVAPLKDLAFGLVVAGVLLVLSGFAIARGGNDGGNGVSEGSSEESAGWGGLGVPPEMEDRAAMLEQSFSTDSDEDLARQRWAGTLCENHPCGDDVSEGQAKDLLDNYIARGAKTGGPGEHLARDARELLNRMSLYEMATLLDQQTNGTLCMNHRCGSLGETHASKLVDRFVAERATELKVQAIAAESDRNEARWAARIGIAIAFFGLLISWLALRQSSKAEKQSARNEVEIEHLKAVPEET